MDIINGDKFLLMADIVLRKKERTNYYPVNDWNMKNLKYFEDIVSEWNNPKLLFCNTEDINAFRSILKLLQNRFLLITHNSDTNIDESFLDLCDSPNLIHWFSQNAILQHAKLSYLPIGIANPTWNHGNPTYFEKVKSLNTENQKQIPVYANFLIETNKEKREVCASILTKKGVYIFPRDHPVNFIHQLSLSFFCVCPEGNGIDTHRFWESLLFKTIPIVIRSSFTEMLRKEYPCILLDSWEDLTADILIYDTSVFTKDLENKLTFTYFKNLIEQFHAL
jgi:hypothetical protein